MGVFQSETSQSHYNPVYVSTPIEFYQLPSDVFENIQKYIADLNRMSESWKELFGDHLHNWMSTKGKSKLDYLVINFSWQNAHFKELLKISKGRTEEDILNEITDIIYKSFKKIKMISEIVLDFSAKFSKQYDEELAEAMRKTMNSQDFEEIKNDAINSLKTLANFITFLLIEIYESMIRNSPRNNKLISKTAFEIHMRKVAHRIIFHQRFGMLQRARKFLQLTNSVLETTLTERYISLRGVKPEDFDIAPYYQLIKAEVPYKKLIAFFRKFGDISKVDTISAYDVLMEVRQIPLVVKEDIEDYYREFPEEVSPIGAGSAKMNQDPLCTDDLLNLCCYAMVHAENTKLKTFLDLISAFMTKEMSKSLHESYYFESLNLVVKYLSENLTLRDFKQLIDKSAIRIATLNADSFCSFLMSTSNSTIIVS